jgi:hypothetical protein
MNTAPVNTTTVTSKPGSTRRIFSPGTLRRGSLILAILATVIALFYTEENWRGKRAWERFKEETRGRGVNPDWKAYIPPPVPDEQNFFKAPNMQRWFTGRGATDFSRRISYASLEEALLRRGLVPSGDVTIVPGNAPVAAGDADLVLQYNPPLLSLANPPTASTNAPAVPMKGSQVQISAETMMQMTNVIKRMAQPSNQDTAFTKLADVSGRPIGLKPLPVITPLRIVVRTDSQLSTTNVAEFFPKSVIHVSRDGGYGQGVVSTGSNTFRVALGWAPYAPVADFLAWSDTFQEDFAALSAALDRPFARMDGDYEHPWNIPIPNFVTTRQVAQILALRAQCHLLLDEPDQALRELTLMHHLCRLLEGRPTGQPMTLVAAMINVAVKGLYVGIIGDGFRLHAWREPQLAALQQQLAETDLLPHVRDAFVMEALNFGRTVEMSDSREIAEVYGRGRDASFWKKMEEPIYAFCRLAPHGWLSQNAVRSSRLLQMMLPTIDPANRIVLPQKVDAQLRETELSFKHLSPYNYLSLCFVPNFVRAVETAAKHQTLVNEALVVCALERHRLARGNYPETTGALVPEFAEKLPRDVIGGGELKYRREDGKFTLYSIGWNETDEGGLSCWNEALTGDLTKNDWVWTFQEASAK